jgi:hypothetical protein
VQIVKYTQNEHQNCLKPHCSTDHACQVSRLWFISHSTVMLPNTSVVILSTWTKSTKISLISSL